MREAIHWTGHASRVRRELGEWFGDEERAGEKLVAELSAAYVTARLSLPHQCDDAHAPYVDSWIRLLERDERAIHIAATRAQRVADYLVVATGSERVEELATRPLDDRAWIVVYLDVVEIGRHPLGGRSRRGRQRCQARAGHVPGRIRAGRAEAGRSKACCATSWAEVSLSAGDRSS